MRWSAAVITFLFVCCLVGCSTQSNPPKSVPQSPQQSAPKTKAKVASLSDDDPDNPLFVIDRPTIIAFELPLTKAETAELEKGEGESEAYDDFSNYYYKMENPLKNSGVRLEDAYAPAFRVRVGDKITQFRISRDRNMGFYFFAPNKPTHAIYGVSTDMDTYDAVRKYFGIEVQSQGNTP